MAQRSPIFLLGISFILINIAGTIYWTIFRVFIYVIGGSFTEVALVSIIQSFSSILLSPFWGSLGDITKKRKNYIILGSLSLSLSTILFIISNNVIEYLLVFLFSSTLTSMIYPNLNALISTLSEKETRGKSLGYFYGIGAIGWTIGGLLSGYIADTYGMNFVFALSGIVGIMGALIIFLFLEEEKREVKEKNVFRKAWQEVINTFKVERKPVFNIFLLAMAFHSIGVGIFFTLFQIKFFISVGESYTLYGLVSGLSGIGSIIAPPLYGSLSDRFGRKNILMMTILAYSLYFIILGIIWDPIILTILWFLPLWPGIRISSIAFVSEIAEEKEAGKYQGFLEAITAISRSTGALLGGVIADMLGANVGIHILDYILMSASIASFISFVILKVKVKVH